MMIALIAFSLNCLKFSNQTHFLFGRLESSPYKSHVSWKEVLS